MIRSMRVGGPRNDGPFGYCPCGCSDHCDDYIASPHLLLSSTLPLRLKPRYCICCVVFGFSSLRLVVVVVVVVVVVWLFVFEIAVIVPALVEILLAEEHTNLDPSSLA
jgi:hypothetical protein